MTLPSSGTMTAAMINVELGRASNAPFSINGAEERALAGKPSGAISFSDFYGKSNILPNPAYYSTLTAGFNNGASSFRNMWGWSSETTLSGAIMGACSPQRLYYGGSGSSIVMYAFMWMDNNTLIYYHANNVTGAKGLAYILDDATNKVVVSCNMQTVGAGPSGTNYVSGSLTSNPFIAGNVYKIYMA